jgi:hypothetical protein
MNGVMENDWKAFAERWREAAKEERRLTRLNPPTADQASAACLELLTIYESLHGNPFVKDSVTLRKERDAQQAWLRLRQRWQY